MSVTSSLYAQTSETSTENLSHPGTSQKGSSQEEMNLLKSSSQS